MHSHDPSTGRLQLLTMAWQTPSFSKKQDLAAQREVGFTLLEIMVALAVLGLALTSLYVTIGNSLRASAHAKMISQATLLCRYKLSELEERFALQGLSDTSFSEERSGNFFDHSDTTSNTRALEPSPWQSDSALQNAYQRFQWTYRIEPVSMAALGSLSQSMGMGGSAAPGMASGQMSQVVGLIQQGLEQKIRKVTVQVLWDEPGYKDQRVEVSTVFIDNGPWQSGGFVAPRGGS